MIDIHLKKMKWFSALWPGTRPFNVVVYLGDVLFGLYGAGLYVYEGLFP